MSPWPERERCLLCMVEVHKALAGGLPLPSGDQSELRLANVYVYIKRLDEDGSPSSQRELQPVPVATAPAQS